MRDCDHHTRTKGEDGGLRLSGGIVGQGRKQRVIVKLSEFRVRKLKAGKSTIRALFFGNWETLFVDRCCSSVVVDGQTRLLKLLLWRSEQLESVAGVSSAEIFWQKSSRNSSAGILASASH